VPHQSSKLVPEIRVSGPACGPAKAEGASA
jgi:hypothetical protein